MVRMEGVSLFFGAVLSTLFGAVLGVCAGVLHVRLRLECLQLCDTLRSCTLMVPLPECYCTAHTRIIMVPMSEKRHRLYEHEIPEMIEGLRLRLETLLEARVDPERAEIVFRTLYRLRDGGIGRPRYPEFSWEFLEYYLDLRVPSIE